MPLGAALLSRKDRAEIRRIGICRTIPYLNTQLVLNNRQTVTEYADSRSAVEAVVNGDIDAAFLYAYDAVRLENLDKSGLLVFNGISSISVNLYAVSTNESNHLLLSILSKCANQMDRADLEAIVSGNLSVTVEEFTLYDWIITHPTQTAVVVALLFILLLVFFVQVSRQRSKVKFDNERRAQEKIHQKQIEIALESAEHANLSKTMFLNSMSHEIRTPMNGIIGMTNIAKSHIEDKEKLEDCFQKISNASDHLLSIINDILDISRIESGTVTLSEKDFNLSELIKNSIGMCMPQVKQKRQELSVSPSAIQHKDVIGDPMKLQQVFLNILSNAIKYTPEKGSIKAEIRELKHHSTSFADYEFICTDNGIGMKPAFVKRIFEPFARSENEETAGIQGTGLGMVISRNLVRMMGGDIKVESEYKKGSSFTVSFSLKLPHGKSSVVQNDGNVETKPTEEIVANFEGKRILLVEDNDLNREIAVEILEDAKAVVETAVNGKIAVEMFEKAEIGHFDLILMDIQMPVMNGYDATRAIRASEKANAKAIPIVAMSANAFVEDRTAS